MNRVFAVIFVTTTAFVAAPVFAEVKVKLNSYKVVTAKNKERLIQATDAKPGDLIEYRAVYKNTGEQTAAGVVATLPIPGGMEYVNRSVKPGAVTVSVDGRHFSPPPLKRKIVLPAGGVQYRTVPYREYRYLRWRLGDIPAGKNRAVRARVKVVAN